MRFRFIWGYFSLFFVTVLGLQLSKLYAQGVQLIWNVSEDSDVTHYGIYRTTDLDSSFTLINTVSHPDSSYLDETIQWNSHYYYAATSLDQAGNESGFSNIVAIETPTPVELSAFSAHVDNDDAILEWSTASESNNYGFEIQRNHNNSSKFEKIGLVNGKGTTSAPNHYRFVDSGLANGSYYYRLKQADYDGTYEFSNVIEIAVGIPGDFRLYQNHPNPFNSSTMISYSLPQDCHVKLTIYNINGRAVYKLVDEFQPAGNYNLNWDGIDSQGTAVSSGVYYYKMETQNDTKFRRMIMLR